MKDKLKAKWRYLVYLVQYTYHYIKTYRVRKAIEREWWKYHNEQ